MPETTQQNTSHAYTRRTFLQAMLAAPLALGATALLPEEAEAASLATICKSYVRIKAPKAWKSSSINVSPQGHTGGNYHIDIDYHYDESWYGNRIMVLRFDGMYKRGAAHGETKASSAKIKSGGIYWTLKRGRASTSVYAANTPLLVWESMHGQGSYAGALTEAQAKELLKLTTGGKIKYATLMKCAKSTAKKRGAKAVKAWVSKKIVKKCTVL